MSPKLSKILTPPVAVATHKSVTTTKGASHTQR